MGGLIGKGAVQTYGLGQGRKNGQYHGEKRLGWFRRVGKSKKEFGVAYKNEKNV